MKQIDLIEHFRQQARADGVPDEEIERWIAEHERPCVILEHEYVGQENVVIAGKFGGHPRLPADLPLPRLPFLASVDLAALPLGATDLPLPADGTLLFFADVTRLPDDSAHQLVYLPAGTPVSERTPPPDDPGWPETFSENEFCVNLTPSLPDEATDSEDYPHAAKLAGSWAGSPSSMLLQLGGHLLVWKKDPTPGHDWVLLAEFGTQEVLGPEPGLTQWMIRSADLVAKRFDNSRAFFEQIPRQYVYACEFPNLDPNG